jgi:hypothetical protein
LLSFYYNGVHTFLLFFWLFICVWNGGCYYVKHLEYNRAISFKQQKEARAQQLKIELRKIEEQLAEMAKKESSENTSNSSTVAAAVAPAAPALDIKKEN